MRKLVPAETLVYLETNDLAAALQPIVDSKPFREVAKTQPDFSMLKGVQVAIAVTGFETSEEKIDEEQSIGRVRPRFVAIADTHAFNYQSVAFAEQKLGGFVADIYNSEPKLEKSDKNGGKYFTWTATDGRKAFALVIDSLIWFSNDETAIDKCLAVRRGEADSIAKAGKVPSAAPGTLAFGYVSTDGIANIASIVSVKFASESSEQKDDTKPALAEMLAALIRGSATEIRWDSTRTSEGIEDRFSATLPAQKPAAADEIITELVDSLFEDLESTAAEDVAGVLAERKPDVTATNTLHRREDRFTPTTTERRIVTDLGFIGWTIGQLDQD